ncbi:MAG: tetratricopeptide repeat protein, partial [Planctomycetota bacterium]
HSYFLLGIALTGACLLDRLQILLQNRKSPEKSPVNRKETTILAVTVLAQVLVCFVNPWGWRLATLPVQTLLYLRAHGITGSDFASTEHPWSFIVEFHRPLAEGLFATTESSAFCILLVLAAVGAIAAGSLRRWGSLLLIAAIAAASLSMKRNIAPAAFLIIPGALGVYFTTKTETGKKPPPSPRKNLAPIASIAVLLVTLWFSFSVVTQKFYFNERATPRFGLGLKPLQLPLHTAKWVSDHPPKGRVWTDFNISSNLYYLTNPHVPVPIMTNTWAYPPAIMKTVMDVGTAKRAFDPVAEYYSIEYVVLEVNTTTSPLIQLLGNDPKWALVHLDAKHVVFQDSSTLNSSRDVKTITKSNFDVKQHIDKCRSLDPIEAHSLYVGGLTLFYLGWEDEAAELFKASVESEPSYHEVWNWRGICAMRRSTRHLLRAKKRADLHEAIEYLQKALEIKPDYEFARFNLNLIEKQLQAINRTPIPVNKKP